MQKAEDFKENNKISIKIDKNFSLDDAGKSINIH